MSLSPVPAAPPPTRPFDEDEDDEGVGGKMSFLEHLDELRQRLIKSLVAVLVGFIVGVVFIGPIFDFIMKPLQAILPAGGKLIYTDPTEAFMIQMKMAALVGIMIALPVLLWQIWAFIAPGLYAHEKRFAMPLLVASCLLFLVGMAFAYWVFFPNMFLVMTSFTPEGVAWMTDIDKYLGFVMGMFLAFGAAFEVPVVVVLLVTMQIATVAQLAEWRRYIVVGIFIVAAVVTPPDVASQLMLALPMCLLYEIGLVLGRLIERRRAA